MIRFVPYAYGFLRSYAQQDDRIARHYTWNEPFCHMASAGTITDRIIDPYMLCASCYVWNHNQHVEITARVKKQYPDCLVVMGGPHIPNASETYFKTHPHVDILVHGEGEITFHRLLSELLETSPDLKNVPGISFNVKGLAVKTDPGLKLAKHLPVPSPYLSGLFDSLLDDDTKNVFALLESNRGCPFSCSFCDWGVRTMNTVRHHDMERIRLEIQFLAKKGIEDIYVTDSNFGLFRRDLDIAEGFVENKKKYGFPKRIRIQFAKKTNARVLAISKLLHEHDMLWGTTLSLQSVNTNVIEAVGRPRIDLQAYREVSETYSKQNIPTYTELILGLPLETKESFIRGICRLFDMGMHDDFRVFELALLPNAPLAQPSQRKAYRLHTKEKAIRKAAPGCATEFVEVVFGTRTMSHDEWADCLLFAETTQALHNGGYTRFVAIFLKAVHQLSFFDFYTGFLDFILTRDVKSSRGFLRVQKLIHDYYERPPIPQVNKIFTQPDMMAFLTRYNPDRKGWPLWSYLWLWILETLDSFYTCLRRYIESLGMVVDDRMNDLIQYQRELMLTPDYNPQSGKQVRYAHDWHDYFFNNKPLRRQRVAYHYHDQRMGTSFRYDLVKNNRKKFVTAAIGYSYPYSKFKHFFHQPDMVRIEPVPGRKEMSCHPL